MGIIIDEWSSGVWRPGDEDKFYINFPDNDIVYIGEGYPHDATVIGAEHASGAEVHSEDGQYIKDLVGKIEDGDVPTGTSDGEKFMYTASIHMRDTDVVSHEDSTVNTVEGIQSVLDELMPLVDSGQIIFVDYETAAEIWETEYSEVPYRYDLFEFKFYKAVRDQAEGQCEEMAPSR